MAFWSDSLNKDSNDPKRKYRFTVQIDNLGFAENSIIWFAKSVNKPSFTISEADHTFLDKKYYYPGRLEWNTVTLTLVDPVDAEAGQDAVRQLNKIIEAAGYNVPTDAASPANFKTMSKGKAKEALGSVVITQINAQGNPIEVWTLNNPFVKDLKFGDLDYTGDELIELTMELRYDWATCDIKTGTSESFYSTGE